MQPDHKPKKTKHEVNERETSARDAQQNLEPSSPEVDFVGRTICDEPLGDRLERFELTAAQWRRDGEVFVLESTQGTMHRWCACSQRQKRSDKGIQVYSVFRANAYHDFFARVIHGCSFLLSSRLPPGCLFWS